MDMFATTDRKVDLFPSTNDINAIAFTYVETVALLTRRVSIQPIFTTKVSVANKIGMKLSR